MPRSVSRLVPEGLSVDAIRRVGSHVVVTTRSRLSASACPACGCASSRVHSRYRRLVADLPSHGHEVTIEISVRRFRCVEASCRRRIFAERVANRGVPPFARRTERLDFLVHHCGLALGGRPAARLARRLMLPVSRDTLLRTVRRRTDVSGAQGLRRVGIDDWAWRKGMSYGTLVCDLDRRRIVDLLPDREPATVAAWLASHSGLDIVARDRGGSYARAAAQGAPQARQVADRWHLMENASAAFLSAVRRSMTTIRKVVGATVVDKARRLGGERGGRGDRCPARTSSSQRFELDAPHVNARACDAENISGPLLSLANGARTIGHRTMEASVDYPTDEEFEAWREEALADEACNAEPAPEPRSKKRAALALLLEHHKPDVAAGENWDDALRGLRPRDMAEAVWDRHSFGQYDDPPMDHDTLLDTAAWLLRYPDWAPELWGALLFQRHRFLHAQPGDLP